MKLCTLYIFPCQIWDNKLQFNFFSLSISVNKQFSSEGSANIENLITFLEIETCSNSKVDEEGKEHTQGHHFLLWKNLSRINNSRKDLPNTLSIGTNLVQECFIGTILEASFAFWRWKLSQVTLPASHLKIAIYYILSHDAKNYRSLVRLDW